MGRKKKDQADKSGSLHNESINEQQQTTCTDAQISTNTITMSSGLIGNVSQLSLDGNLCQNWSDWLQEFNIYLIASGYDSQPEIRKISIFLHFIGKAALKIYNSFNVNIKELTLDNLIFRFNEYFIPRKNVTVERHKFFTRYQLPDESINEYVADLTNKSMSCEFESLRESLIKDMLICGLNTNNIKIKQCLLKEDDLTLEKALKIATSMTLSQQKLSNWMSWMGVMKQSKKY